MTTEELAAHIGEMANRCCERSDGFKEEIAMTVREMVEVAIGRAVAAEEKRLLRKLLVYLMLERPNPGDVNSEYDFLGLVKAVDDKRLAFGRKAYAKGTDMEREACAQIADVKVNKPWPETAVEAAKEIAWRIRARGESAPEVQPDAVAGD